MFMSPLMCISQNILKPTFFLHQSNKQPFESYFPTTTLASLILYFASHNIKILGLKDLIFTHSPPIFDSLNAVHLSDKWLELTKCFLSILGVCIRGVCEGSSEDEHMFRVPGSTRAETMYWLLCQHHEGMSGLSLWNWWTLEYLYR